ncbi:hypothetical protein LB452_07270 [Psychroflexus sp. CAK8W]|uniref:Import component protein n=1 Tax=Psychroflexus longus TaxID=2873596 RepID=A0ABS7XJ01_9FLAO|nr:hypothetical protein [Psychroflexus longus]MBZ9778720.1 hypothetical protein [Psychroflexus longus]
MKIKKERSGKTAAIVAYFTIFGSILALLLNSAENKHEFASFHIRQALGVNFLVIFISIIVSGIPETVSNLQEIMISTPLYLGYTILWLFGFIGAVSGKQNKVPLIGNLCQTVFKKLT